MVGSSTLVYATHIEKVMRRLQECAVAAGNARQLHVYLPAPGVTPRQDEYVRKFSDRRTTARARHWRDIAAHLARAAGWRFVDQWALTRAHVWEVMDLGKARWKRSTRRALMYDTDMSHFLSTDALDPIIDEVIAKAGLCPPDASPVASLFKHVVVSGHAARG
jgi:hypothetical protein